MKESLDMLDIGALPRYPMGEEGAMVSGKKGPAKVLGREEMNAISKNAGLPTGDTSIPLDVLCPLHDLSIEVLRNICDTVAAAKSEGLQERTIIIRDHTIGFFATNAP